MVVDVSGHSLSDEPSRLWLEPELGAKRENLCRMDSRTFDVSFMESDESKEKDTCSDVSGASLMDAFDPGVSIGFEAAGKGGALLH